MNKNIDKNSLPRVKIIQKIYGSLMNPELNLKEKQLMKSPGEVADVSGDSTESTGNY